MMNLSAPGLRPIAWNLLLAVFCIALALSPTNSKIAGLSWLVLILLAICSVLCFARTPANDAQTSARLWLFACMASITAWTLLSWIWQDPCCDSSGDLRNGIRLLLAAAATYVLACHAPRMARLKVWPLTAMGFACFLAVGVVYRYSENVPSHGIPWATSISFFVCLVLPLALSANEPLKYRLWLFGACFAGLVAVALSQKRGTYLIFAWVALLLALRWRQRFNVNLPLALGGSALALMILLGAAVSVPSDPLRLRQAWSETQAALTNSDYNTSLGARVYLFELAAKGFMESPLIGIGAHERLQRIQTAGLELPPAVSDNMRHVRELGHAHNQYLHNAMDGGLLGLSGLLALIVGMGLAAWRLMRSDRVAGLQMQGLMWMHAAAGLSNVNLAHNYYALMLSLSIAVVLVPASAKAWRTPESEWSSNKVPQL